jgi:hypothetical protein
MSRRDVEASPAARRSGGDVSVSRGERTAGDRLLSPLGGFDISDVVVRFHRASTAPCDPIVHS